ncbi:MAG: DUF4127 family protein, partial [Fibrella sp.]|nr:DUF4127 family protein [Armatimonadota bacterium]
QERGAGTEEPEAIGTVKNPSGPPSPAERGRGLGGGGDDPNALTIALLPLDERPVNTRYPEMLGAIAGVRVELPPVAVRGAHKRGADVSAVSAWLADTNADAVIASAEYLLYGNLIQSRISADSVADVLPRLSVLEEIARRGKTVYAFGLVSRVSNADVDVEEPDYWRQYGTRFYQLSQLLHKQEVHGKLDLGDTAQLARLRTELPEPLVADFLTRRLRNHAVNLALLDLVGRGRLDLLLLTSDDTSVYGLPTREKTWLESWMNLLGDAAKSRIMMHPGADEVGSALLCRLVCAKRGVQPAIYPLYAVPGGEEIVAPYEDRAARITVEAQIRAGGGRVAESLDGADIVLGVLPPSPRRTEWKASFAESERSEREPFYRAFLDTLAAQRRAGVPVAVGDITYPNGSDPLFMELLFAPDCSMQATGLAAYGAWNTAGNTLGTTVAQAILSTFTDGVPERQAAQSLFLTHRFLEDWAYQAVVRHTTRDAIQAKTGRRDPAYDSDAEQTFVRQTIEAGLTEKLRELQAVGVGVGLSLVPGSVRLPWRRTFEADFDLV